MNLRELTDIQYKFDKKHGWKIDRNSIENFVENINCDLVGFMGELGEFSNIIKKTS